jgi:prepilin-type N-terminal cleavage/methylation domain-containing protein
VQRSAFTLVELLMVIAVLGLISGIAGLTLASRRTPRDSEWLRELRRARSEAIRTGMPVWARNLVPPHTDSHGLISPLFLPDGRAVGAGVDPLTGAPIETAH